MRPMAFIKSPMGTLAVFIGFVVVGGLLIYRSNLRTKAQAAQMTKVEETAEPPAASVASFIRAAVPFKSTAPAPVALKGSDSPDGGDLSDAKGKAKAAKPVVLPISLFSCLLYTSRCV